MQGISAFPYSAAQKRKKLEGCLGRLQGVKGEWKDVVVVVKEKMRLQIKMTTKRKQTCKNKNYVQYILWKIEKRRERKKEKTEKRGKSKDCNYDI